MLLSDGSVTRHLQLLSRLNIKVECMEVGGHSHARLVSPCVPACCSSLRARLLFHKGPTRPVLPQMATLGDRDGVPDDALEIPGPLLQRQVLLRRDCSASQVTQLTQSRPIDVTSDATTVSSICDVRCCEASAGPGICHIVVEHSRLGRVPQRQSAGECMSSSHVHPMPISCRVLPSARR